MLKSKACDAISCPAMVEPSTAVPSTSSSAPKELYGRNPPRVLKLSEQADWTNKNCFELSSSSCFSARSLIVFRNERSPPRSPGKMLQDRKKFQAVPGMATTCLVLI